ncbi:MAG: hypothetical protein OEY89_13995 [Gammaproteobacteria bacterium]|nr:hypothetical protein [Gammaproteobacteria bacterium]
MDIKDYEGLDGYASCISHMMKELDKAMDVRVDTTDEYKNRQYLRAMLNIVYGITDLDDAGTKQRQANLEETKRLVAALEIME